jgi:hypothetical protein
MRGIGCDQLLREGFMRVRAKSWLIAATLAVAASGVATPTLACLANFLPDSVDELSGEIAFTGTAVATDVPAPFASPSWIGE